MNPILVNEDDLYLTGGGPFFRLIQRIGIAREGELSEVRRIIGILLITWVPMCIFSLLQGCAIGSTPRGSFLLDFATYARFFVGAPILIIAEGVIGPRLRRAGLRFVSKGLIRQEDYPAFERAIARLARRRESPLATFVLIALAAFGAWKLTALNAYGGRTAGWQSLMLPEGHAIRISLAALWNYVISVPIVLFLLYRWHWRLLIWTLFLRDVSRLKLELVPTHADQAGGIGFLATAHDSLGILTIVVSSVLGAEAAFRIVYEGAKLESFQVPFVVLLVAMQILVFGPLLIFCPMLSRARRTGLAAYSSLVIRYNRDFQKKWLEGGAPSDEHLLGSADIQSLADLGNSFRFVDEMRLTPFSRRSIIQLAITTAIPTLPPLLLVLPFSEIVSMLSRAVR